MTISNHMPKQKIKINYRFALTLLLVLLVFNFLPLWLLAAGLVPSGANGGNGPNDYHWPQLIELFKNVVRFIFVDLMIPLAVLAIVYAGIQVLLHRDNPSQLSKAWGTLKNVGIGIFMALGAYAIVYSILTLLNGASNTGFLHDVITKVFETNPNP